MSKIPRNQRVEAIVLNHSDWGEADRLLVLFTRELGKIRAVVKGARKMRSRKAGHLEPFTRVDLLLARGRDLWIVTQAEMNDAYQPLRENLEKTAYAAYVVELIDRFTYEEGQNQPLYRLLRNTLQRVANETDPYLAIRYYEVRCLDLMGFRPNLFECVNCGKEIQAENQYFSFLQGGVLCPRCGIGAAAVPVSMRVLKYFRYFQRSSYADAKIAPVPGTVREELETLIQKYLSYLLEREINSTSFLARVRKLK